MSPERARRVANGILAVAGVALVVVVWRQPALRRAARQLVPLALREIRPVHVAAIIAALASPPAAGTAAAAAARSLETSALETSDAEQRANPASQTS